MYNVKSLVHSDQFYLKTIGHCVEIENQLKILLEHIEQNIMIKGNLELEELIKSDDDGSVDPLKVEELVYLVKRVTLNLSPIVRLVDKFDDSPFQEMYKAIEKLVAKSNDK
jgi:hypothetical protein